MEPRLVFEGIHFKIFQEEHNFPDGRTQTFEYAWRKDGTRVLAVRSDHTVLLCREFRYELNGYDWKLPGGKLDSEHEDPAVAAARELREETGYVSNGLKPLTTTIPFATVQYSIHFFLTYNPLPSAPDPGAGEMIKCHWVPLSKAVAMAISGDIREEISALTIIRFAARVLNNREEIPSDGDSH